MTQAKDRPISQARARPAPLNLAQKWLFSCCTRPVPGTGTWMIEALLCSLLAESCWTYVEVLRHLTSGPGGEGKALSPEELGPFGISV